MAESFPPETLTKIQAAAETPYQFPQDTKWTDKDCAALFNYQEE